MMKDWYNRMQARLRLITNHGEELNRRVDIENKLMRYTAPDSQLPTKEECRIMALKLGTPRELWPESWLKKRNK